MSSLKPQSNILLITVDCWRGDHIGIDSLSSIQTPQLKEFAKECHYFPQTYTCGGWTKIAMTALFSSTYASMYGFARGKLSDERPLLAEVLSANGYETAGFSTNPVCGSQQGFSKGFQTFEDLAPKKSKAWFDISKLRGFGRLSRSTLWHRIARKFGIATQPAYPSMTAEQVVTRAQQWLEERSHPEKPYFLWLHLMDLHWPYQSSLRASSAFESKEMWVDRYQWRKVKVTQGRYFPGESRAKRWKKIYAEETEQLDKALGLLIKGLKARDDWQQTAVCITADHGEEFYEHGSWAHSWNQLHSEGLKVPLLIRTPGQLESQQNGQITSHLDIAPTLLKLAGITKPEKMLGEHLPIDGSQCISDQRPVYSEMLGHKNSYKYRLTILYEDYKYLYDGDRNLAELYDLTKDPEARKNIYKDPSDGAKARNFDRLRLAHISKGALNTLNSGTDLGADDIYYDLEDDPAIVERMRALGYMD